jgi:hypothetical protein
LTSGVAGEALGIVSGSFANQWQVRIVTGDAGDARIAVLSPAAAVLKTVGLKAHFHDSGARGRVLDDICPGAMACPTEVDGVGRGKTGGIHDRR